MKARALVSALAGVMLLGLPFGSAAQPGCVDPKNQLCTVEVTVTGCDQQTQVTVNPDHLSVKPANPNKPWTITWTMKSNGFEFVSQAPVIVFKGTPMPPTGMFKPVSSSATSVVMTDDHKGKKEKYQYSIVIVKTGGAKCITKDPTVDND